MSEYIIELPDSGAADEFVAKMGVEDCRIYGYQLVGEIVRCKDCRWNGLNDENGKHFYCTMWFAIVIGDEYCSRGIRKEI